jgi:hypothetical protein
METYTSFWAHLEHNSHVTLNNFIYWSEKRFKQKLQRKQKQEFAVNTLFRKSFQIIKQKGFFSVIT